MILFNGEYRSADSIISDIYKKKFDLIVNDIKRKKDITGQEAEDIVSGAFERVYKKMLKYPEKFSEKGYNIHKLLGYIYLCCSTNASMEFNRRYNRRTQKFESQKEVNEPFVGITEPNVENSLIEYEMYDIIDDVMKKNSSSHTQRIVFKKRFIEGKDYKNIAYELNVPMGTVKSAIKKVKEKVRKELNEKFFEKEEKI